MSGKEKSLLRSAFDAAIAPVKASHNFIKKHVGYEVANRGWTNDAPMTEYPKLKAIKAVFRNHAKNGPLMLLSPVHLADLVRDVAVVASPNHNKALLPKFKHDSTVDMDALNFTPDPSRKARLMTSSAHDTKRSFMRSFATVVGMYWTKAGIKEISIATTLAAAAFYTSKESVDVLAEFSYWGRDFTDFLTNSTNFSHTFKAGILDVIKNSYELDSYTSTFEVLKSIASGASYQISDPDIAEVLGRLKIDPKTITQIAETVQSQIGNFSLSALNDPEKFTQLENTITLLELPQEQYQDIIKFLNVEKDTYTAAQEIIGRAQDQFAIVDFNAIQTPEEIEGVVKQFDEMVAQDILQSTEVSKNFWHLVKEVPQEFGLLLGKFLAYILPSIYTAEHLALRWETWTKGKITNEWTKYKGAYHIKYEHTNIDNPDQRIEQNISDITGFVVDTMTDGMQTGLKLFTFIPMLAAMGSINPSIIGGPDIQINNYLVWAAVAYAAVGTGILGAIAHNLPEIRRNLQRTAANFRAPLISVHNQSEQVALTNGGEAETKIFKERNDKYNDVRIQSINKSMQMRAFNSIHGNVGSYIPAYIATPLAFGAVITYGQTSQAMGIFRTVEQGFEFIKNIIPAFAGFKAGIDRTAQLIDALELVKYEELERRYYMALEDNPELAKHIRDQDKTLRKNAHNDDHSASPINNDMDMD